MKKASVFLSLGLAFFHATAHAGPAEVLQAANYFEKEGYSDFIIVDKSENVLYAYRDRELFVEATVFTGRAPVDTLQESPLATPAGVFDDIALFESENQKSSKGPWRLGSQLAFHTGHVTDEKGRPFYHQKKPVTQIYSFHPTLNIQQEEHARTAADRFQTHGCIRVVGDQNYEALVSFVKANSPPAFILPLNSQPNRYFRDLPPRAEKERNLAELSP